MLNDSQFVATDNFCESFNQAMPTCYWKHASNLINIQRRLVILICASLPIPTGSRGALAGSEVSRLIQTCPRRITTRLAILINNDELTAVS